MVDSVEEASMRVMIINIGNKVGFLFPLFQALVYLWSKDFIFSCSKYWLPLVQGEYLGVKS